MRRGKHEMVKDILDKCYSPIAISNIMGACNISYDTAKKLLDSMVKTGYLELLDDMQYQTTSKGNNVSSTLQIAEDVLNQLA